jgi:pimeloyl-ACP methyl ester carboxylesterase
VSPVGWPWGLGAWNCGAADAFDRVGEIFAFRRLSGAGPDAVAAEVLGSFANGRLIGERTGTSAPSVLALHGWARSCRDFSAVLSPPDGSVLEAIALDLPGFGAAAAPPVAWGSRDYAEYVAQVLDEMDVPIVVLGHSFGGRVAVQLARMRPEAVTGLVLTGVPLWRPAAPRRPALRFRVARSLRKLGLLSEARLEQQRQRFGSSDYRSASGVMRSVLVRAVNESYDDVLSAIRCPVDLVWGADDEVAPVAVARWASERLLRPRLRILPGVGHMTPLVAADELRAAVLERLAARLAG